MAVTQKRPVDDRADRPRRRARRKHALARVAGRWRPAWLALAVAASSCAPPTPPLPTRLLLADSVVAAWVEEGRIPGAVLRVSRAGEPILERAYGWAQTHEYGNGQYRTFDTDGGEGAMGLERLARPLPMTVVTQFDLASVTKVVATTMAIMLLVDRGEVDLVAPVARYLPDFLGGGKEAVTIEHLLTHRSGLAPWKPLYYRASTPDEAYALIREMPLEWDAGAERHYSDLGFMILGLVVEHVTARTLEAFLSAELYRPLGLAHTGFRGPRALEGSSVTPTSSGYAATSHGNPYEHRMVWDDAFGYRIDGDSTSWDGWRRRTLVGEVNDGNAHHAFGGVAGHAGLFATAVELDVLLQLLIGGGELRGRRWLRAKTIERFLASTGEGQALGWQLPTYAPAGAFAHTGFTGTFVLGDRASGIALVLLTNRQNGGVDGETTYPDVGPLQRAVTRAIVGG